ncbi:MAG: hypothetical protein GX769_02235 [Erysipelothrix sp.]|nr:hypothetical protein [Erysipelothrix sp.]
MLKDRLRRIALTAMVLIFLFGCSSLNFEENQIQIHNNQGIFFNKDNELFPIYSLKSLDSSDLIGSELDDESLKDSLLEIFYNGKEGLDIPINELSVNQELKIFLNKNFKKPIMINVIYSDTEREIIIPYEWEDENYVQFDVNNLKRNVVYTFQVTYIKQDDNVIKNIETYIFPVIFK